MFSNAFCLHMGPISYSHQSAERYYSFLNFLFDKTAIAVNAMQVHHIFMHINTLSLSLPRTYKHTRAQAHTPTYCTHTHICARNILFTSITEIVGLLW